MTEAELMVNNNMHTNAYKKMRRRMAQLSKPTAGARANIGTPYE